MTNVRSSQNLTCYHCFRRVQFAFHTVEGNLFPENLISAKFGGILDGYANASICRAFVNDDQRSSFHNFPLRVSDDEDLCPGDVMQNGLTVMLPLVRDQ